MDRDKILKGKKILVVDDEKDIVESLLDILSNCDVETVSTYEQAEEALNKNIDK